MRVAVEASQRAGAETRCLKEEIPVNEGWSKAIGITRISSTAALEKHYQVRKLVGAEQANLSLWTLQSDECRRNKYRAFGAGIMLELCE